MFDLPLNFNTIFAGFCALIAFCIVVWQYLYARSCNKKEQSQNKNRVGMNITVDSRDFISMDTKRAKVIFDGLEKIVKIVNKDTKKDDKIGKGYLPKIK